jgi:transcriptional regulator with AAA-type ATPase domain
MGIFRADDAKLAETISRVVYCNPFLPERIALEKEALGPEFEQYFQFVHVTPDARPGIATNVQRIMAKLEQLLDRARQRVADGNTPNDRERALYEDVAIFFLYYRFHERFRAHIDEALKGGRTGRIGFYPEFEESAERLLRVPGMPLQHGEQFEHLFAFFFQFNRAFVHIYEFFVGGSLAAAHLRGRIWQSIFTHDVGRYRRTLYERMADIATLITGPSGTGKELVARAVGLSRYIPFDPRTRQFKEDFLATFHALNLSALSPTLIESELFGHKRGAFTGALADRKGWFDTCSALGTVFLDEIGDLDGAIQVKLLRVLQSRTFQRLGETDERRFGGKIIAATNRDLARAIDDGKFRADLYYRLCADVIVTPALSELVEGDLDELRRMVLFVSTKVAGAEAPAVASEVMEWIEGQLGVDYAWPGNFRELEQCVRNVLVRREYHPALKPRRDDDLAAEIQDGVLTAEQLIDRYCHHIYKLTGGNLSETARRVGLDRRTVRARVKKRDEE